MRNYLINRKVQLTITAVMVAISTLLTALLGFFWYAEVRRASEVIRVNAITTIGPEAAAELAQELARADMQRLLLLAGYALLLALLISVYGIVTTHRFAGPLAKISKHMQDVANNRLYGLWGLRRGDHLKELHATFERMHTALRKRNRDDIALLRAVIADAEAGGALADQLPALREALADKEGAMRDASETTQRIRTPAAP